MRKSPEAVKLPGIIFCPIFAPFLGEQNRKVFIYAVIQRFYGIPPGYLQWVV